MINENTKLPNIGRAYPDLWNRSLQIYKWTNHEWVKIEHQSRRILNQTDNVVWSPISKEQKKYSQEKYQIPNKELQGEHNVGQIMNEWTIEIY